MLLAIVLPFLWLFSFPYAASFNHVSHFDRRQQSCPSVHLASPRDNLETTARISDPTVSHSNKTNHDKNMPKAPVSSPYNLLWSPGMFRKLAWTGLGLALAHHTLPRLIPTTLLQGLGQHKVFAFLSASHSPMHCWIHELALPMLASACCLLQLMLNALSIGCAGFNKYLGPVRPYFVGVLLYLSIVADATAGNNGWRIIFFRRRPSVQLMLRWTVALLPELLFAWDRIVFHGRRLWNNKVLSDDGITATTITLSVPTMGCMACVNAIQNAVSRVEGVESVWSHLTETGGETVVRLSSSPGDRPVLAATEQTIVKAIADSGFPGAKVIPKTA
jgi:copper chaperone CopZ